MTSSESGIVAGTIASLYVQTSSPSGSSPGSERGRAPVATMMLSAPSSATVSPSFSTTIPPPPVSRAAPSNTSILCFRIRNLTPLLSWRATDRERLTTLSRSNEASAVRPKRSASCISR